MESTNEKGLQKKTLQRVTCTWCDKPGYCKVSEGFILCKECGKLYEATNFNLRFGTK